MKPARLVSVAGSAFGSFVEPFEVHFPESGLVHLRGENLDTKGSSASGKSTFIHAINYPLGTCPVPLTALQSWYTKDAPKVTETWNVDGKIVKVTRGKRFLMEIDGQAFNGSADQKEEKLDELFGIDAELRLALTYRAQREEGLFLSKTDKKQKEFLTKLLRLDKFEEAQKESVLKVKELEGKVAVTEARLQDTLTRRDQLIAMGDGTEAEASLADVIKQYEEHDALKKRYEKTAAGMENDAKIVFDFALDLFAPKIAELDTRIEAYRRVVIVAPPKTAEWERLKNLKETVEVRLARLEAEDLQKTKDHLAAIESMRSEWQALAMRAKDVNKLLADKDRITADMKQLSKNCCPTCLREWEEAKTRLEDLKVELEQIKGEEEELRDVKAQADELKADLDAMPRTIEENEFIPKLREALAKCKADMDAEDERNNAEANAALAKLNVDLRQAQDDRVKLVAAASAAAAAERDKVLAGIGNLKVAIQQEQNTMNQLLTTRWKLQEEVGAIRERRQQIELAEVTAKNLKETLGPLQIELAKERDFAHLVGREAFRGKVFDEALDAISAETNAILASIANTRNCTLEFKSDYETGEGKVRQEIVPEITINGHKAHSLDWGPSGGMLSAIELAVDLAVGRIVAERTGVCPGWLILDESFDGLGPREKDTCLEMLQLYAADRLVIIVDHTSETAGFFTQNITVKSQNGISRVEA